MRHAWERNAYTGGRRKSEQATWKIQSIDRRIVSKLNRTAGGQVDSFGSVQGQL